MIPKRIIEPNKLTMNEGHEGGFGEKTWQSCMLGHD